MRWEDERQSDNVEARRGPGGRFGGVSMRRGGIGIGTVVLALLGGWLPGTNPLEILGRIGGVDGGPAVQAPARIRHLGMVTLPCPTSVPDRSGTRR